MTIPNVRAHGPGANDTTVEDALAALTSLPSFPGLQHITASVDMLGWYWSYGLSEDEKRLFGELVGKRVVSYPTKHGGWLTRIPSPHHHLNFFAEWLAQRRIPHNLVHIALDLQLPCALEARSLARRRLVMDYAPNAIRRYYESGNFYLKDTGRPLDLDGEPLGPGRRNPARFGYVYPKTNSILRIEARFAGKASVEKYVPPLHAILDADPRFVLEHWRWRTYRPRLLTRAMRAQEANSHGRPLDVTRIWDSVFMVEDGHEAAKDHVAGTTTIQPLNLGGVPFSWA